MGVNSWVEHRDRSIFGHDADEFKPERWLISESEQLATMNRHWMPVSHYFMLRSHCPDALIPSARFLHFMAIAYIFLVRHGLSDLHWETYFHLRDVQTYTADHPRF